MAGKAQKHMKWEKLSNEELLQSYAHGSFPAFDTFFRRNSQAVFLFIMSRSGDQREAEDILQETFIRIHKYIHRYDTKRSALNWVFAIARNQILTQIAKRTDYTELDESIIESKRTSGIEARNELISILSGLDENERNLILDRFLKEESYEEMSTKRNLTTANTRQKVSRILKKIRTMA
ncbi:MAG: sigma-70 family RNA polymerase sigma factor [Deltaproteobacteria bacterium]|nr:sigma-70 family RNA polymerase sigma factor [Deltaproteobacteria bacterium]